MARQSLKQIRERLTAVQAEIRTIGPVIASSPLGWRRVQSHRMSGVARPSSTLIEAIPCCLVFDESSG